MSVTAVVVYAGCPTAAPHAASSMSTAELGTVPSHRRRQLVRRHPLEGAPAPQGVTDGGHLRGVGPIDGQSQEALLARPATLMELLRGGATVHGLTYLLLLRLGLTGPAAPAPRPVRCRLRAMPPTRLSPRGDIVLSRAAGPVAGPLAAAPGSSISRTRTLAPPPHPAADAS
ncbi:hypothetical protein [Streptomyces fumanus]|uniref:hypothetical protein n=1 Tax=Streptomyces fumanus TaxID=67302 RepID=UPI0033F8D50F